MDNISMKQLAENQNPIPVTDEYMECEADGDKSTSDTNDNKSEQVPENRAD